MTVTENTAFLVSPRDFAQSDVFSRAFSDGMELVEEAAGYLEGAGRAEAKELSRDDALIYARESMGLTTQLMQLASWLLVHRAVREGEMSEEEAREDRYRLELPRREPSRDVTNASLPEPLLELMSRTERLYKRMADLDQRLFSQGVPAAPDNPVGQQLAQLAAAINGKDL